MGRKKSNLKVVRQSNGLALSTLADQTVIKADLTDVDREQFLLSAKGVYTLAGLTEGEGPIMIGFAHGDYTTAEIAECISATGSWASADQIAQEQARRKVRIIGEFSGNETDEVLNDGLKVKTVLKFMLQEGQNLALWAMNRSGGSLTTGAVLKGDYQVFMRPS